jgi:hypothetical protein
MIEIWKDIPDYDGHYQVSNLGNVRSTKYLGHTGVTQELKQHLTQDGYYRVPLFHNGRKHSVSTHILVAKTFIQNPDNKPQVNHIDGNKQNNTVSNLEWVTGKENIDHAIRTGLRTPEMRSYLSGESHYFSKPIYQYDFSGKLIKKWGCISDAARYFKCKPATITNCSKGRIKSCKGYMWRYFEDDAPSQIAPLSTKNYPRLIIQKSLDGNVIKIWNGYEDIKSNTNYRCGDICACCKGGQKTAFGYIWEERPIPYK